MTEVIAEADMASPAIHDAERAPERIREGILVGGGSIPSSRPPRGFRIDEDLGLLLPDQAEGAVLYRNGSAGIFETRAELMPDGDLLLMFPDSLPGVRRGHYAHVGREKVNRLLALRSSDRGRTWSAPFVPFDQPFNQHGFVPISPRGTSGVYCFGTQPDFDRSEFVRDGSENAPIGFRRSDDSGRNWSEVSFIEPLEDPGFQGMTVIRGCETARGTWLLSSSRQAMGPNGGRNGAQGHHHILRSADRGRTWSLQPGPRGRGWVDPMGSLVETSIVALPDGEAYSLSRTLTGRLWEMRSVDDGLTWSEPRASALVHPWAPAMSFLLEDRRTIIVFHHNVSGGSRFDGDSMACRAQLWVSLSRDGGRSWSEPRFLLSNALVASEGDAWRDHQCSYVDLIAHRGELHVFMPHRWRRALHLRFDAGILDRLPTAKELGL